MPLFMVISGMVSHRVVDGDFRLKKRLTSCFVPCISSITILTLYGHVEGKQLSFAQICIDFITILWYLKSLFACWFLTALYCKFRKRIANQWHPVLMVIIIFGFFLIAPLYASIPIQNMKIDFMLPFFLLGIIVRRKCFNIIVDKRFCAISFVIFCMCLINFQQRYIYYFSVPQWISFKELLINGRLIFDLHSLYFYTIRFITGASGSLFLISLFANSSNYDFINNIGKYGSYTLYIYVLQNLIVDVWSIFNINISVYLINAEITSLLLGCSLIIVFILVANILKRSKFINRFIFGLEVY